MLLKDWINWFSNKLEGFGDYIPDSWSYDSEAMDPVDKQILADQAKQKTLRNELSRLKVQREKIIRSNHRDDLGRAKQKLKICQNWHSTESSHLEQQKERLNAIIPVL
jgi:hypothetical protein